MTIKATDICTDYHHARCS